ncbi:GtrA family protein [Aminipila luticellarii]|uniref:Glycosyltransferase n=1 Tax=Aminipila luticellarii TaxID=2507160 RepID=A0A410PXI2_9FIRM|nr:GtrA family protein [Aminipila luticellarii]QAT43585.1 glycosyltransferase [Aminipila luticellarii]
MADKKNMILVIPAYEPDEKMIELLQRIHLGTSMQMIVVDDGSDPSYRGLFKEAEKYAFVITHPSNRGKGSALKTAFSYIQKTYEEATVVTADSDGQHKAEDILAVAQKNQNNPDTLTLGSRKFVGDVPLKSRLGNGITSKIFEWSSGTKIRDTQTGLRAFDMKQLPFMLSIPGNRYEYEMNMLLYWAKEKKRIDEEPIETIYLDKNTRSHFHPLKDSYHIYKEIIKFSFSSFIGFLVDFMLYSVLIILTKGLSVSWSIGVSNVTARIVSAMVNYYINRKYVFKDEGRVVRTAAQYAVLAAVILVLNTLLLSLLVTTWIPNRFAAKIIVELILFIFSCFVQKKIIFKNKMVQEKG